MKILNIRGENLDIVYENIVENFITLRLEQKRVTELYTVCLQSLDTVWSYQLSDLDGWKSDMVLLRSRLLKLMEAIKRSSVIYADILRNIEKLDLHMGEGFFLMDGGELEKMFLKAMNSKKL